MWTIYPPNNIQKKAFPPYDIQRKGRVYLPYDIWKGGTVFWISLSLFLSYIYFLNMFLAYMTHTHTTGTSIVAIPKHPYFNHILFLNMFLLYVNTHMQIHTQRNLLCPSSYLTSDKVKLLKCITSYIHANTWRIKWHTPYSGMFTAIFYCQPRQMPSNEPRNLKYSANAELL